MLRRLNLTLGFSPCPNDTFIFDALVNNKINTGGIEFTPVIADVEELNRKALTSDLDVTKMSFFAYAKVWKKYRLLDSGGAAGYGCGPLVISDCACLPGRQGLRIADLKCHHTRVAIPGTNTTANLLFTLAFPHIKNKRELLFSEIEDAVLAGNADVGVIIHESRFTYRKKGLRKIADLGEFWKKKTGMPVPLGAIAVKNTLPASVKNKINGLIRQSVLFAMKNPNSSIGFVRKHSQEMEMKVLKKHIALYVNRFTISFGNHGRKAIRLLFEKAFEAGLIRVITGKIFLD